MSVNKHDVMKRWVETFLSGAKVSFDNIDAYQGARSLIPEYGEYLIKQDIVGNKTKQYTFGFVAIETLDQYDVDTNNTDTRQLIDGFNDWLVTQEKNRNYPDFGDDVIKYKIIPLYNTSNIAQVFTDTNLAKYILMARIEYVEKE
jgi:hypothetical protein